MAILVASYNFYEQGFVLQAILSAVTALFIFTFFIHRLIKNRRCVFGNAKDCNEKK
jgi:hypothetical protein